MRDDTIALLKAALSAVEGWEESAANPDSALAEELRAIRQTQAEMLGLLRSLLSSTPTAEGSTERPLEAVGRPLDSAPGAPNRDPWPQPSCTGEGRMARLIQTLQEKNRGPQ